MKKLSLIFILLALLTFHSCDLFNLDNDPTLPEITQEGKGTFGCLIDGELFLPKGPDPAGGFRGNPYARFTEADGTLVISAQNTNSWSITLATDVSVFEIGEYILRTGIKNLLASDCDQFAVDTLTSILNIHFLDKDLDIVSGTFSGHYLNECDSTDILTITDGRFDLPYSL